MRGQTGVEVPLRLERRYGEERVVDRLDEVLVEILLFQRVKQLRDVDANLGEVKN